MLPARILAVKCRCQFEYKFIEKSSLILKSINDLLFDLMIFDIAYEYYSEYLSPESKSVKIRYTKNAHQYSGTEGFDKNKIISAVQELEKNLYEGLMCSELENIVSPQAFIEALRSQKEYIETYVHINGHFLMSAINPQICRLVKISKNKKITLKNDDLLELASRYLQEEIEARPVLKQVVDRAKSQSLALVKRLI